MKIANTKYADKYFHSKANCEASQLGDFGEITAKGISDLREFTVSFRNIIEKKMTIEDSLKDIKEDQDANKYGRKQKSTEAALSFQAAASVLFFNIFLYSYLQPNRRSSAVAQR